MNALQTANYILSHQLCENIDVTPLKLQKLMFYIKVWSLIDNKPDLVKAYFLKWTHGPVNVEIYYKYKEYKNNPIPKEKLIYKNLLSISEKKLVDFVLENYLPIDAISLSVMTHHENPWKITSKDCIINDEEIINFYSSQSFAKNFPLDYSNKTFYPLITNNSYAYFADMTQKEMDKLVTYKSYSYFKKLTKDINFSEEDFNSFLKDLTD